MSADRVPVAVAQLAPRIGEPEHNRALARAAITRPAAGPERGEALLPAELNLAQARDKRVGDRNDVLADRRPELYGAVQAKGRGRPAARAG